MLLQACRQPGRLLFLLILLSAVAIAATPGMTTISDTVYRADGLPASGTVLISWPAFNTAANQAVAAGTLGVNIAAEGALTLDLVPNVGASPTGTLYRVVYKLDDGTTATEYWSVGSSSPTTIAAVRSSLTSGTPSTFASRQYVDTADAANRAYVDTAVAAVGAGSFVSKTGDSMSGPLTLPADPTAPNHAATRHYVDTGLSAKAGLITGLVPADQLGSGTADATRCLKGDQSWGACGTSSNAVSLQGVPIAAAAPTDGQVPTYEAATSQYRPKAPATGLTPGMQAIKYASDLNWSSSPASDLSTPGPRTVNLTSCPPGVRGSESEYWIYISATGTGEAAKVTGGTCAGDGSAGTLQFTTVNAHPAGYTLGSASSGLQEAIIAARLTPTNPTGTPQSGKIVVSPGEYRLYARVSIRASTQTIDFTGSILECYMNDTCLFAGDLANPNAFTDITLINPRGRPMVVSGTNPFLEVNAQKTRISNVMLRLPATGATFGTIVQVDDDQAFLLDGMEGTIGVRCDATFCGSYVSAPGPFNTWSAVGWLKNLNISPQCTGNGVLWQSGNTLRISDSVIQGYAQYGLRTGRDRGGYGNTTLENVYMEAGNCTNPAFNNMAASAGVIANGGGLTLNGGEGPQGVMPCFSGASCSGTPTDLRYYVVANKSGQGASNAFYAGRADSTGSGTINVRWPAISSATSYDLLVMTATGQATNAPYGTGNFAVATAIATSSCAAAVCTFADTQGARSSYAVATPNYYPKIDFWPGDVMLGGVDSTDLLTAATMDTAGGSRVINSELGTRAPAVFSKHCGVLAGAGTSLWATCLASSLPPQTWYEQGSTIVAVKATNDGGTTTNLKGRFNFSTLGSGPSHILTLYDSNFAKTIANRYNRPNNDVGDMFIGYDNVSTAPDQYQLTFGAPKAISQYINNVGDGTNWKERLTSSLKEFKTDVKVNGNLTVTGTCTGCGTGGGASAPAGSDGQLVMIDGSNGLKVISNLSWDGTRFHIPGNTQVDGRLSVAGPLDTETDLPSTSPVLSTSAKFKMAVDTDGRLKGSYNGSTFSRYLFDTDTIAYSQITNPPAPYTLPVATASVLGGVKGGTCAAGTLQRGFQADGSPNCASMGHDHSDANNGGLLDSDAFAAATKQGTGTKFAMAAGTFTSSNYRSSDANGNAADSGVAAGPYTMPWITFRRASATTVGVIASANRAAWWGVVLTFPLTTTQVTYEVGTADNTSNTYDIGIYDASGALRAHIGPTPGTSFAPATGVRTLNWLSAATLQPGRYYLAYTSSCTAGGASCAQLAGGNGDGITFLSMAWMTIASGGTLNGPLTPPADTWSFQSSIPAWAIR